MSGILVGGSPSLKKPKTTQIYGVEWNFGVASCLLSRLADATGLADPQPAVGSNAGSSPFDTLYPWSEMVEFNIVNDEVSHQKGDASFSRTSYDTCVRIPKFWYKVELGSSSYKLYIATGAEEGYALHPAFYRGDGKTRDYIYVGRYNTGGGYVTRSGIAPLVSLTRAVFRSNSAGKGADWWQYDIATYSAISMLYLVEYADWNSQTAIGRGYVDASAAINNGGTDGMAYHTGRAAGTDGLTAVQYRGIENLWGNVWDFVDGINFNGATPYFCLIPSRFADDTSTNYTGLSYNALATAGNVAYPTRQGVDASNSWLNLPTTGGGSDASYIPDGWWSNTGWRILLVGGYWSYASSAGLFARNASNASSTADAGVGGRLLFLP
ncbi:MAG: hypothetical protein Q4B42_00905 [Oscillospiraceae bacterium]|nr:hypothetical protein [Oscillospiraceae bacterium]